MNVSASIPATVRIRRGRLLGLVVGVAALAAAVTWALTAFAFDTGTTSAQKSVPAQPAVLSLPIPPSGFLDAIRSVNPAPLGSAAIPVSGYLDAITTRPSVSAQASVLASLSPSERRSVERITSLSPAELSATFGTGSVDVLDALGLSPRSEAYVRTITSMSPAELEASFGNVDAIDALGLSARQERYVRTITAMSPDELVATFGTSGR